MGYENYERLLLEKGIKTSELCRRTGIDPSTISNWKKGKYMPRLATMKLIADFFGVDVSELSDEAILFSGLDSFKKEKECAQFYDHERFHAGKSGRSSDQEDDQYYIDPETAAIAQQIKDSPDLRMLLDASRDLSPDTLRKFAEMMLLYKK